MAALFSQRLHFLIGKGGVGKTTVATAFALATSRLGKKTLLIELDENTRAARNLGLPQETEVAQTVRPASPLLSVLSLSGQAALEEYLQLIIPATRLLRMVFESQLYQYFVTAAPGLKELLMMGKVWYEAHKKDPQTHHPLWDMVIVDTPATGHSLQYLDMPWAAKRTFQGGLVDRETERITALLSDPQQTAVHLVTIPEELPVSETLEAYHRLVKGNTLPLGHLFINRVHTAPISRTHLARARINKQASAPTRRLAEQVLSWAEMEAQLAEIQADCLKKLASVPLPAIQLPFCFAETFGLSELEQLASIIAELGTESSVQPKTKVTKKRRRSG